MKKYSFLLMVLLCLSFLFTGCPGGVPEDEDDSGAGSGTNPEASGKYNFKASKIGMTSITFTWDDIPDLSIGDVECKTKGAEKTKYFHKGEPCTVTFSSLEAGKTYTFEFYAGCDDYHNSETITDYTVTTAKKGPVEGFRLYYYSYDKTISVFWDEIDENAEVSAVKLYKKTGAEGTYTLLKEYKDEDIYVDVEYEDEDVEKGNDYYYKAVTIDNDGNEIEAVEDHYEIPVGSPEKPANLTVEKQSYSSATITWDENPIATSYIVYKDKNNSTYFPEWEKVEEVTTNSYTVEIFDKKVHYAVEAKNETGTSSKQEIEVQPKSLPSLVGIKYTATQNSVTFTFPEISSEDAGDVKYFYAVNDKNIYEDYLSVTYKAKSEENKNTVIYSGLEFAKNYDDYAFIVMYKENADGTKTIRSDYKLSFKFATKAFDAPTNVQVSDIKRTSATVSFEPIKEFYGISSSKVFYRITIENKGGSGTMIFNTNPGSNVYTISTTDEEKRNKNYQTLLLSPGTEYTVTVEARTNDFEYDFFGDKGVSEFTTGKGLSAPAITSVSEVGRNGLETEVKINYTDSNTEAVSHNVYYKIQNASDWKKWNTETSYLEDNKNTKEITVKQLNAGNRYTFRIDSYPDDEPAAKVYSETEQLQCEKIPDNEINMPAAIKNKDGSVLNLSGKGVFVTDKGTPVSIRSDDIKGYSWGVLNFADENGQFVIPPIGNYSYYTFKLDMTDNLDGKNEEKLLLFVSGIYGMTWNGSKLGSCDLYIVKPNDTAEELAKPKPFDDFNVPMLDKDGNTDLRPSRAGYVIPEEYMYNNSVYIGVKDKSKSSLFFQEGETYFIGFSYYY